MLTVVCANLHPAYSRGEQVADRSIHYAGLIAALLGSTALIVAAVERQHTLTIACVVV